MALNADEALLDALSEAMGGGIFVGRDPDGIEPSRRGDGDGDEVSNAAASAAAAETTSPFYDDSLPPQQSQPLQTAKQERMVLDQMVRHEQRIGKNFTGPKGVLADKQFHDRQEYLRQQSIIQAYNDKLNSSALPSGWLQREIAREEAEKFGEKTTSSNPKPLTAEQKRELYGEDGDEEGGDGNSDYSDTDDLIRQLEEEIESSSHLSQQQRSVHLASLAARAQRAIDTTFNNRPRFGSLQHLGLAQYLPCIDNEDPNVLVVIHVYSQHLDTCRTVNNILAQHISRRYAHVKFAKVLATDIDFGSEASGGGGGGDTVALPALLCYKGGQLVHTLLRIADEIPGFAASGRCEADDFEEFLVRRRILNDDLICD